MSNNIPITEGQGQTSVAAEQIGAIKYQQIKVIGGEVGSTSVWGINPDRSAQVSVVGTVTVTGSVVTTGSGSISGAVNISGSVLLGSSNASVITVWQNSSVIAVPTGNQSVSGALNISGSVMLGSSNASVITVWQNSSILAVPVGSVITVGQGSIAVAIVSGSILATVTPPANQSVSGAINVSGSVLLGSSNASVITVWQNSSVIAIGAGSIVTLSQGSVITVLQSSSLIAINAGSVVAVSVGSVITVWQNSSVLAVPVGSVITVLQAPSIVGTYAEDAASAGGDKGVFVLGIRNDTVASFVSADLDYTAHGLDSAGRTLVKPFAAEEARVEGYHSVVSTSVTTLVAAAGTGIRNYITDIMVANTGATTTLITFKDGLGSILGYTIAPTGGGSNLIGFATPMRTGANASFDFQPTSASSIIFATVKGYKAP